MQVNAYTSAVEYRPLSHMFFPAPLQPPLSLAADWVYRPTRAMQCSRADLAAWAQMIPGGALERFQAVFQGDSTFVLGKKLPWFAHSERFWGQRVLVPIGLRPHPLLPEAELRAVFSGRARDGDLLVLRPGRSEFIAEELFAPLSHAAFY